jgi:hypothetical protein
VAAVGGSAAAQDDENPRILFSRDGNIHMVEYGTLDETQITKDGTPENETGGTAYGCPVWAKEDAFAALAWTTNDEGAVTRRDIISGELESEFSAMEDGPDAVGLGVSYDYRKGLYLGITKRGQEEDNFGAELTLFTANLEAEDVKGVATKVKSFYGGVTLNHCRLRMSPDGRMVSVPSFPTDVSDLYHVVSVQTGRAVEVEKEAWLGGVMITGVDFTRDAVYATIAGVGEDPPLEPGLYKLDLQRLQHKLVVPLESPQGLAVCEAGKFVVVSTLEEELFAVDLTRGTVHHLVSGTDPDVWPR